ncbi:hypothetical protein F511_47417 [Dorcoceras hygrometricum]|uniref:Uncharacterized protein n=1 Tax=Dorcoceras hygrometricum TaxID=472368 RepID=A0A2Z6ZXE6_9LAMI|nr:hypothetical protein F511_47417 [Dorcoceras hygrometricum]
MLAGRGTRCRRREAAACATLAGLLVARLLRDDVRLATRLPRWRAPLRRAQNSSWRRRRLRPPLRRVSGDVVTAGLNSSRVWFGPVPASP